MFESFELHLSNKMECGWSVQQSHSLGKEAALVPDTSVSFARCEHGEQIVAGLGVVF